MALVTALPEVICAEIFSIWSEKKDVTKLDSATCNERQRSILLSLLASHACSLGSSSNENYIRWISFRDIKLQVLTLTGHNFANLKPKHDVNFSRVNTLQINKCYSTVNATTLTNLINFCPLLSSIVFSKVEGFSDDVFSEASTDILSQLTNIHITDCNNITGKSLQHLGRFSRNLRCLDIDFKARAVSETDFLELVTNNRNLEHIRLQFNGYSTIDRLLNHIATNPLSRLTRLEIRNCKPFNLKILAHVIKTCLSIQNLHLTVRAGFYTYVNHTQDTADTVACKYKSVCFSDLLANGSDRLRSFFTSVTNVDLVSLTNIDALTDSVLGEIATKSPNLSSLTIDSCGDMYSYNSIYQVLVTCKNMQILSLIGSQQLGNHRLVELFALPHRITSLTLSHINALDAETVKSVVRSSPCLSRLCGLQFRLALKDEVCKWLKEQQGEESGGRIVELVN